MTKRIKYFFPILCLSIFVTSAYSQSNYCFKQIDSIVEHIITLPAKTTDSGKITILNGIYREQVIRDPESHEILALLQNYKSESWDTDTIARVFFLGIFFHKDELLNVREFELTGGFKKVAIHYYYYTKNACADVVYSDPDLTKKLYYFRLAHRLREYYSKNLP